VVGGRVWQRSFNDACLEGPIPGSRSSSDAPSSNSSCSSRAAAAVACFAGGCEAGTGLTSAVHSTLFLSSVQAARHLMVCVCATGSRVGSAPLGSPSTAQYSSTPCNSRRPPMQVCVSAWFVCCGCFCPKLCIRCSAGSCSRQLQQLHRLQAWLACSGFVLVCGLGSAVSVESLNE